MELFKKRRALLAQNFKERTTVDTAARSSRKIKRKRSAGHGKERGDGTKKDGGKLKRAQAAIIIIL